MNAVALSLPVAAAARRSSPSSLVFVPAKARTLTVPKHMITGRYTGSLGLRIIGTFAPAFAERMLTIVREWVERVSEPVGGQARVVRA